VARIFRGDAELPAATDLTSAVQRRRPAWRLAAAEARFNDDWSGRSCQLTSLVLTDRLPLADVERS